MADEWSLKQNDFEMLLAWLDSDREQAGTKYEVIRETLINIFTWRGCRNAEDLADETINRVIQKLPDLIESFSGDPARYFYGVAKNVIHEHFRREAHDSALPAEYLADDPVQENEPSPLLECLDECLQKLSAKDSEIILSYYQYEKGRKIEDRKELAKLLGIKMNALRIRAFRLRSSLERCIRRCIEQKVQARQ